MNKYQLSSRKFNYVIQNDQYDFNKKILIAMVGLPAQGKSFFGKRLENKGFMEHGGNNRLKVKVFNAGQKRRIGSTDKQGAEWFAKQKNYKELIAMETLQDAMKWLESKKNNNCAIFDATNSTLSRRKKIYETLQKKKDIDLVFVEIVCPNKKVRDLNVRHKVSTSPNYKNVDMKTAVRDFEKRVMIYRKVFVSMANKKEEKYNFIKMIIPKCLGKSKGKMICNNISPFHWLSKYCDSIPEFLKKDEKKNRVSSYK